MNDRLVIGGQFWACIIGLNGRPRRWLRGKNAIVTVALNDLLEVYFKSGTAKPSWFLGLIDDANFDELAAGDSMGSHAGWQEFTAYDEAARQAWTPGTVSGGNINNPAPAVVTITTGGTLKGAFLVSNSTKGGSTGVLWCHGEWDSDVDQVVVPGELVKFGYVLKAANG